MFKLKISTFDNRPIIKAQGKRIEDFDSILSDLKKKYRGSK